jgi:transcriptional regulator with XRE-family HTH domain
MHKNLKEKITEYLEDYDTSIQAFERKAKLNRNSVYSIITDKSKNPNIETVLKIADALDCSLDELLERKNFLKKTTNGQLFRIQLKVPLFRSICTYLNDYIEQNQITGLNLGQLVDCIEEIYKYCLVQETENVDKHFATWYLKNNLLK